MEDRTFTSRLHYALSIIHWRNVPVMILLFVGAILMIMPFLWMVSASFRPIGESYRLPPSILPDRLDFAAYAEALSSGVPFVRMYWNSFVVATLSTAGVLISSSMAAFAFARLEFRSREFLFMFMLLGLMVPPALVLIPIYFGYAKFGLLDTELGLATLGIITFIASWNNFVSPFVLITSWDKMTLPVGVVALQGVMGSARLSVIMAAATMSILPLLLVFLVAQRFIVESITMSGVKG